MAEEIVQRSLENAPGPFFILDLFLGLSFDLFLHGLQFFADFAVEVAEVLEFWRLLVEVEPVFKAGLMVPVIWVLQGLVHPRGGTAGNGAEIAGRGRGICKVD